MYRSRSYVRCAGDRMRAKEPPTQVVYRFDDHRYLELKGWDCEGELWYTDTQRGIHTEPVSQFYRIFTKIYSSIRAIYCTDGMGREWIHSI